MENLLIITPVKDSIETAIPVIKNVCKSKEKFPYWVYNDYSSIASRQVLESEKGSGYGLINIEDHIETPSPNYRFTLIDSRKKALELNADLLIVESDVYIKEDTIEQLFLFAQSHDNCGMVAAITVDEHGTINFPYKHISPDNNNPISTHHRLSFCCTLLTNRLLSKMDFEKLSDKKDWFDVQISKDSRKFGLKNYVLPSVQVLHLPHSSRPWKKLKYSNPVKYYFRKWLLGKDKI